MGPFLFLATILVVIVVTGFMLYGAVLGLATLGQDLKRLMWPESAV